MQATNLPTSSAPLPLKILLSAFACAPALGSEEGVGWGIACALAEKHRVHVLTTPRFRREIEEHLALHPQPNLTFSFFDYSWRVRRFIVTSALWQIYYHGWQCRIAAWAAPVAQAFAPDVVHHLTYARYWTPTTLWKLGRPFVWGSLGGADQCPPAFLPCLNWRARLAARMRTVAQWFAHLDPRLGATAAHCDLALASTPATAEKLGNLGCPVVSLWHHNAVDESLIAAAPSTPESPPLFCTVGRLLGWKGNVLAIRAFAKAAIPDSRLFIIGEGPVKKNLIKLAAHLGVAERVWFPGALARPETLRWMEKSVAVLHPSLHDQAATVVIESLALGVPVIALKLGGSEFQITAESGFVVQVRAPEEAISDMAAAMRRLVDEPDLRRQMAAAGIELIRSRSTWTRQAERFEEVYRNLTASWAQAA